ncbi:putative autophagy protein Atg20, partial [Corchorus capsularis]
MLSRAELKAKIQDGMNVRNNDGQPSKGKGKGGGSKRLADDPPPKGPKASTAKKPRTTAPVRAPAPPTQEATSSATPTADVEGKIQGRLGFPLHFDDPEPQTWRARRLDI